MGRRVFIARVEYPGKQFNEGDKITAALQPLDAKDGDKESRIYVKADPGSEEASRMERFKRGQKIGIVEAGTYKGKPYYALADFSPEIVAKFKANGDDKASRASPGGQADDNLEAVHAKIAHHAAIMGSCYLTLVKQFTHNEKLLAELSPEGVDLRPGREQLQAMAVSIYISISKGK